ncbi:MAG: UvrD-helicase domain-containing protein, partial [Petrimonas sp.]|nr:UvrD-helicase domain-containing protein [Petrimonas sp.]
MQNRASSDRQRLQLIRASAGSGKTHRLTGEYLRLLFSAPYAYRHILAVTFTNKATEEMKSRIVEELHTLSSGEPSDYLPELTEKFAMDVKQVRTQAGLILKTILHDYSAFAISTIDRFFQQTMRAFTREMGLAGGYNVEVDDSAVLLQIIDMMLFELDKPENRELGDWLLDFMKDKIQNDKAWNIRQDVEGLAKQLFSEKYKTLSSEDKEKIHDKNRLTQYRKTLQKIVRAYEKELKDLGIKAVNIMDSYGLHYSDFKWGKSSGFGVFPKLANGVVEKPSDRLLNLADDIDLWFGKEKQKQAAIADAYAAGLNDCVKQLISISENGLFYYSANAVLNYFYTLGILNDIHKRLNTYQKENNTLFLSDTTELLNKIISGSETPFVYEKIGTRINNYMIDEFQDTSGLQWDNFRPLISESLSHNHFNLVVGDVKQSIYRWRSSDWRLLEEQITKDFTPENVEQHSLDTNWRSDANVIAFNNAVFRAATCNLQEEYNAAVPGDSENDFTAYARNKITDAYTHVYQQIPEKKRAKNGYVKLTFLNANDEETDWTEQSLERLPAEIESLQDQGFALRDIAIIVRKNDEAVLVAEKLLAYAQENPSSPYRYDIISNEALVIGNAQSVKAVIALMRYFQNRKDDTKKMLAAYEFYRFHRKLMPGEALNACLSNTQTGFPEEVRPQLENMASLSFYEMIEAFFALSEDLSDEKENAYVQAFLDIALKFSTNSSSDINNFLEWWDEKGYKKTLFLPEEQDAIRLITIHKSKGLGFGAVIMPFMDWDIDQDRRENI